MDTISLVRSRKRDILRLAEAHGARNVRVFGSVARGQDSDTSDVDFLVDFEPGTSLLTHAALTASLASLLGRQVDVAPAKNLKSGVRDRILHEAIPL